MRDATNVCLSLCFSFPFQSTHPMRDATKLSQPPLHGNLYFNPRIPCGMRLLLSKRAFKSLPISIHASHAGCDRVVRFYFNHFLISIHASHAGCDIAQLFLGMFLIKFQSTHPMRDATFIADFICPATIISIHASHAGCD